jgi:hypothetical protein
MVWSVALQGKDDLMRFKVNPQYRHGFVDPIKQCLLNLYPMAFEIPLDLANGHSINPRSSFVLGSWGRPLVLQF